MILGINGQIFQRKWKFCQSLAVYPARPNHLSNEWKCALLGFESLYLKVLAFSHTVPYDLGSGGEFSWQRNPNPVHPLCRRVCLHYIPGFVGIPLHTWICWNSLSIFQVCELRHELFAVWCVTIGQEGSKFSPRSQHYNHQCNSRNKQIQHLNATIIIWLSVPMSHDSLV